MSDLTRLTLDLAHRLGATRVVAVGAPAPERLAELAERIPVLALDTEARLSALATEVETLAWAAGSVLPEEALAAGAETMVVCDDLGEAAEDRLAALSELLARAAVALVSVPDRDLLRPAAEPGLGARELTELLRSAGLEPAWLGLTDAHGSLGRRTGLTAAVSTTRAAEVAGALSAGPLGLGFDPATDPPAERRSSRVCIASYEFVGPTRTGGIGTAYTSLAEALAGAGHEVTLLFTGWQESTGEPFGHWVSHYRRRGIELERLDQRTPAEIETGHRHAVRSFEAYRWLRDRDRERPFDVIHFPEVLGHGHYTVCARRLGTAFEQTTIAVGTHSSTSWVLEANGTVFQALDDFADDYIERRCVERCDALISPSAYMLDWMRARGWRLPERRFVQQYARSRAVEELDPAPPPISGGPLELVFFGRLEPRKGLRVFCDALDQLAGDPGQTALRVTFLGKQSSVDGIEAGEYLDRRSPEWPWETAIIDDLGQPEAVAYLRAPGRRLTVIPSLADNSPNTVYEALALEIPFIASRVGGTAELIDPLDLATATFDPQADRRRSGPGASALADRVREALAGGELRAPRPAVAADVCRAAHVRWHADVTPASRSQPELPAESAVAVCLLGTDPKRISASRAALERGARRPRAVVDAAEAAEAEIAGELVLFMPAGSTPTPGAIETLERAAAFSGAEVIAVAVKTTAGDLRVPVGGPEIGGLLRRCFGDTAFVIARQALTRLGGFDAETEPGDQAHQLLCRAALAGVAIEVCAEPLVVDVPPDAIAEMSIVDPSRRIGGVIDAYREAPNEIQRQLPLLTQQLYSLGIEREREFTDLYANRFGRLTLPIRRNVIRARRVRGLLSRRRQT